jgi:hypothetical protein
MVGKLECMRHGGCVMPDCLEVAHQRRLIDELRRDGRSTDEAEIRLRAMLEVLTSFRGYHAAAAERRSKEPQRAG